TLDVTEKALNITQVRPFAGESKIDGIASTAVTDLPLKIVPPGPGLLSITSTGVAKSSGAATTARFRLSVERNGTADPSTLTHMTYTQVPGTADLRQAFSLSRTYNVFEVDASSVYEVKLMGR